MSAKRLRGAVRRKGTKAPDVAAGKQKIWFSGKDEAEVEDKFSEWQQENAGAVFIKKGEIKHEPTMRPPRPVGEGQIIYGTYSMLVEHETKPKRKPKRKPR